MIKKSISIIALSVFLLLGCGESTDEIKEKDKVVILHDVGVTGCLFLENSGRSELEEQNAVTNTDYTSTDNAVSCATYGKTGGYLGSYENIDANMDVYCAELTLAEIQEAFPEEDLSFYENKDKACVLSFDLT